MKVTVFKKMMAASLALITLMLMTCSSAFAAKTGGADLYIGSERTHFDSISAAWSAAVESQENARLVLREDWIAEDGSFGEGKGFRKGALKISSRSNRLTVDLNGFRIDRGLTEAREAGYVISCFDSRLTVTDSSEKGGGLITGGYSKENGGAIYCSGAQITLEGITIAGNTTKERGGAIYITSYNDDAVSLNSNVILDKCTLTGNSAKTGGAVYIEACNSLKVYDSCITGNKAKADAGIHTEVCGLTVTSLILGGKVIIKDNIAEGSGTGLMLDDGWFKKVVVKYDKNRPLSEESEVVILSKTDDNSLRITESSENYYTECFTYENGEYEIVEKGSGSEKYLDIKKA